MREDGPPKLHFDEKLGFSRPNRQVKLLWEYVALASTKSQRPNPQLLRAPILYRGQKHDFQLLPRIARPDVRYSPELERAMLQELKTRSRLLMGTAALPETDLEWLSLGQHYGVATRLLDWTENPLAALWFAVNGARNSEPASTPVVWALTPGPKDVIDDEKARSITDIQSLRRTRIVYPRQIHDRVRAQSGWFTLHHHDGRFAPLETQADFQHQTDSDFGSLRKIEIDRGSVGALCLHLQQCGVTEAVVYPDMGGLCRDITQRMTAYDQCHPSLAKRACFSTTQQKRWQRRNGTGLKGARGSPKGEGARRGGSPKGGSPKGGSPKGDVNT